MEIIITSFLGNIDLETAKENTSELFEIFIVTSSEEEALQFASTFPKYCNADLVGWKKIQRHSKHKHGILFNVMTCNAFSINGANEAAKKRILRILKGLS